jgi:HD superfamily phosphohydrolase
MGEEYEIRDPIYGFITFNEWEKEIIAHPVFQRLRRIRQLALTEMVYPGATHTRFEHSLGVMHLATKMYDAIRRDDENVKLLNKKLNYQKAGLNRDRQLVRITALLHDVGQPCFSHGSEDVFEVKPGATGKRYKHEDYTTELIKGPLRDVIENHRLNKNNYQITSDEICALILGDASILHERIFWKVLISSQLDADRADYLFRDSLHTGVKYGLYDLDRLLVTMTLGMDPETEDIVLGIKEGGWHVAESLITARYQIFSQVYYHKTRRAYDIMLQQFLAETIKKLPPPNKLDEFISLDDYAVWHRMLEKKDSYWAKSILERKHLRKIYETRDVPKEQDLKKFEEIKKQLTSNQTCHWEDIAKGVWYKLNNDESGKEIWIISKEGKASPLSEYSRIVKSLSESRQIRIYVKPEDEKQANKVISSQGG